MIFPKVIEKDNQKLPVYFINETKEKEWKKALREGSWFYNYGVVPFKWFIKQWWVLIIWILSLIVAGFFQAVFQEAGKDVYNSWMKPIVTFDARESDSEPMLKHELVRL